MRALSIAATGMQAQQTNVEVIANNLANMNTSGFKAERAQFEDLLYQNVLQPGSQTSDTGTMVPAGIQLGAGVRTSSVYRIDTQGDLTQTSNPYDMAIQGDGFFKVTLPDGTYAYTRAGNFGLSPTGEIVTSDGYTVAPGIAVPPNALSVTVNNEGQVQATVPGTSTPTVLGQLELDRFANDAGLNALGGNLFSETPASGPPQAGVPGSSGYGTIKQGYLETSNVNPVNEITALITAQRAYEMNSKVITAANQMMQTTAQLGG
ncbi:MAG: flagellar basal-body rod protein FlgG [Alphaproteobacteria bacterium]|nr:flagellar basal-body rod protein FlgG [Alphaproteobacteria bacterium]